MFSFLRRYLLSILIGIAVGLIGAIPLADATTFERGSTPFTNESPLVWFNGILLFLLTVTFLTRLTPLVAFLFAAVGRCEPRPKPPVAIGMMACGTLCVLSALYLSWASRYSPAFEALQTMQGTMKEALAKGITYNFTLPDQIFKMQPSLIPMLLTALVFSMGAGLIALGVWASIAPPAPGSPTAIKVPIPAADAASL